MTKSSLIALLTVPFFMFSCASEQNQQETFTDTEVAEIQPEPVNEVIPEPASNQHYDFSDDEKKSFEGSNNANTASVKITPEKITITTEEGANTMEFDYVEPVHHQNTLAYLMQPVEGSDIDHPVHMLISIGRCVNPITMVVYDKHFIVNLNPYPIEGCGGNVVVEKDETPTEEEIPEEPAAAGGEPLGVDIK